MGVVYKARQPELDRLVALKELLSVHAAAPELVQRFVRESRVAGSLSHPNIVTVHDYVEENGTSYIAMEYMPRGSLRPWVGGLSLAQLAGVLEGLLAGLAAVEPSGIVHRDLKPENVMVSGDGQVKITDFGIAKATQSASVTSFMTATGITVGTPAYMAPEQALSQAIGPWTDLYSVGVMAYEQIVGHLPFHDSSTPVAILMRHINESIPSVSDSRPDLDPALSEWIARLLIKDPEERTRSAVQAWEELEEIVIELLGARWRRDARLPEREVSATQPKPLVPISFGTGSTATPGLAPASSPAASAQARTSSKPEAESGFLSYGRAPTGAELSAASEESDRSRPAAASQKTSSRLLRSLTMRAPASTQNTRRPRVRTLGAMALASAVAAGASFVLAPAGKTTGAANHTHSSPVAAQPANQAYASNLSDAVSKLNSARASAGAQLAAASTPPAQAAAAAELARAQDQAATAVRNTVTATPDRAANTALATALLEMGRGYSMMASGARRDDGHDFDSGRQVVASGTAALTKAFAQLQKLGYRLDG
jgi:serine/threonine protein kinase